MSRMTREELYLGLASLISRRSTCERASVGAVLVCGYNIIGTGYNGAPRGLPECNERGCLLGEDQRCKRTQHAEANAVINSWGHGRDGDLVLYCTHSPCINCLKLLIGLGVRSVVYLEQYEDPDVSKFLMENGGAIGLFRHSLNEVTPEFYLHQLLST